MARSDAQTQACERGTPWVATALPGPPVAVALVMVPTPAAAPGSAATEPASELDPQAGFTGRFTRDGEGLSGTGQLRWANGGHYTGPWKQGKNTAKAA